MGGFEEVFSLLTTGGVDYTVVGSLGAVLRRAPIPSIDVQVVHSLNPENVKRLLPVLESIDAVFRMNKHRRPTLGELTERGRANLLTTSLGPLDLLCTVGNDLTYEDLLPHSDELELGEGLKVRVLRLEKLIELKEQVNGDKDRAMLPVLRATLAEIRKSESGP